MKNYETIFAKMLNEKYYSSKELLYANEAGTFLSPYDYQELLHYIDDLVRTFEPKVESINLKSFNNQPLHYVHSSELDFLKSQYLKFISEDQIKNVVPFGIRNADELVRSRVYSEVEGTLNIEQVSTTRKAIDDIAKGKRDLVSKNDFIIHNMLQAIEFVNTCPKFNEENLFKLYTMLSDHCLDEEDKLLPGHIYRHDGVEVGNYKGCPTSEVKSCMDSLFLFVNENLEQKNSKFTSDLPHIVHYYICYVHPYFDYNGRTARMCSYWLSLLTNNEILPPLVSEAINQTKSSYYDALSESRDAHNDLSYFFLYLYNISIKYFLAYQNIDEISSRLEEKGIYLTSLEKTYIKKIFISCKTKFIYKDFLSYIGIEMSKQGALKILNLFESYGILLSEVSKQNKKLFYINRKVMKYRI